MIEQGTMIGGRYVVEGLVGSGGMADVYKATDRKLNRTVAIKVLKASYSSDANFVSKFRAEAQSAAKLEHPNIVNVYDVGNQNGCYYIIMEFVSGITLKDYIARKGRLNYRETLSIAIQAARGIQAAHANNIIHRDIKPQNIIISSDGKVKVTDFGIARAASEDTIHSDVMGSVHYSSPEQTRNGYVSNRSDIYSLGIVMYEMVTGRVPFDGESAVEVAIKHLQDEMPSPSTFAPDLPISLEKIILKCTQKSADRRYDSIDSLLADLRRALVSPYEDFVVLSAADAGATRVLTEAEAREIQENAVASQYAQPEEEEEFDDKYAYIYDDDDDDIEEEDEDDEAEGGFFNRRMEKTVNILRIVVLVVIVVIVIYILGSFLGWFHFGGNRNNRDTEEATEEQIDTVEMIDLRGMTLSEAQAAVDEWDMTVIQSGEQASEIYEPGQIVSQDVTKGELVDLGATIQVVVASENTTVTTTQPDDTTTDTNDTTTTTTQPKTTGYYVKSQINAPSGVTLEYADISLYLSESDELIQSWNGITSFPYTIEVHGITSGSRGTLIIDWHYQDSNGNSQVSEQEQEITFRQE